MCRIALLFISAVLAGGPVASEPKALTLAEAVERAREHAPGLRRLAALETAAEAGILEARAARQPSLGVSARYTRTSNVPELSLPLPDGGERTLFPDFPDNWGTRLEASVPFYTGGRLSALRDAARSAREAAAGEAAVGDADLVLETTAAYWGLATARASANVLEEGLAAYDQHFADARHREELGLVPRSDVLLVRVERDRAGLALTRVHHDVAVSEENLLRLVGFPPGTAVEIADPLRAPDGPEAEISELLASALSRRAERIALLARRSAREASVHAEDAARRPRVGAVAGYDYARPNREIFPAQNSWRGTWDVSVAATYEFHDGGRARAAAARARAEAEALDRELEAFDARLRVELVARRRGLLAALEALVVAERAVEAAAEARRIVRDRYLEGVSTNGVYLDAENSWLRAGLDRTEALARARLAKAELDRAVGP